MEQGPAQSPSQAKLRTDGRLRPAAGIRETGAALFPVVLLATTALVILLLAVHDNRGACSLPSVCGPLKAVDLNQGRLDTAMPAPHNHLVLEQSFIPSRNGLSEIELILTRQGEADAGESRFTLELRDEAGNVIAARTHRSQTLNHNQTYTLQFAPQPASAGKRYVLRLSGSDGNPISAWGYSLNVVDDGQLTIIGGESNARELRFVTRYTLLWQDVAAILANEVLRNGRLALVSLGFLLLPGVLLLSIGRPYHWDRAAWWGAALSLGAAAWPVLWFWFSLAGGRWSAGLLWSIVLLGWVVVVGIAVIRRYGRRVPNSPTRRPDRQARLIHLLLGLLLVASLASRFVATRDLAFPPWVDSSRHALITAVMVEQGRTPANYEPYLPVDRFPYHFGFHSLSASLHLMTGHELPGLLLFLGQWINGLLPLTVYAAGWMITRRRAVGLVAAFLIALPFFFPGYYATWGRLTQIMAMLVMPVLLTLTWQLGRGWFRAWPLVGVLAAGLFLIHFRVFLFFLPLAAVVTAVDLARRRAGPLLKAGGLALVLVLPRLIQLLAQTNPVQTLQQSLPGYNDFPIGYVTTGWERLYLGLAVVAAGVVLAGLARRRRWVAFPIVLVLWVAILFVLLAGERLGLPETLVVNLNSMYISLFLPLALFLATVAGKVWWWVGRWGRRPAVNRRREWWVTIAGLSAGLALGLLALFGWRQQVNILNPQTILALRQDTAALAWAGEQLPDDALVAVNAWQWLGATWAGSDGGAWLVPLTGRQTTTPPVDHIYNPDLFAEVRAFNEAATITADWSDPDAAKWLRDQGVTHIFVGARGGIFDPARLSRNPDLHLLFHQEGTFVFEVTE
jgi:hypothetical protein